MAGMVSRLITVMNEQHERHSELLGLTLEEKDAIVANDIDTLKNLVNLKNIVISQNNRLEKERVALVSDIAAVMGYTGPGPDFSQLLEMLGDQQEQAALRECGTRLRDVVNELQTANDLNKGLLENAIEFVEYSLNALRTASAPLEATLPGVAAGKAYNVTG